MDPQQLSAAFGLGHALRLSEPVARGEFGEVRRLDTARGSWAIKRSFEPGDEAAEETAGAYHRRCWESGVPTPEPIRATSGTFHAEVAGQQLRAYTWVELEEPDTGVDPVAVGEVLARLHAVRQAARGAVREWYEAPIGANEWRAALRASRTAGAPFAERLDDLLPALIEVESILSPMAQVQTCHLDLWSDNLRATPGGGLCLIDFDNAGPADPGREVAMVVFEFGQGESDRWRTLYDTYRSAGGPGRVTDRGSFAMTVAQLHHIGHRHVRMWLSGRDDLARARSLAGVEEFLHEPLLLPQIDQIVDALA